MTTVAQEVPIVLTMCRLWVLLILVAVPGYSQHLECVPVDLEGEEVLSRFATDRDCDAFGFGSWEQASYSELDLDVQGTQFIRPTSAGSCSRTLDVINVISGGIIEVNVYLEMAEGATDIAYLNIIVQRLSDNTFLGASVVHSNLDVNGWHNVRMGMNDNAEDAYIVFVGAVPAGSTLLIDSYRYISSDNLNTVCDIYSNDEEVTITPEPVTTEPETTEPVTTEPETTEPVTTEPATIEPETTEPVTTEPETTEPITTDPEITVPVTTEPETTEPVTTEPVTTEPETTEPVTTEPATIEPETTEQVTTEPETTEPVTTEPETTLPVTTEPETTEPVTTEPATIEPESTEPVTTEPETTEPVTTEPETTEPVTTEPETTEPVTTEPATTESETTEPVTTEPETTEPVTAEPETIEPVTTEPETTEIITSGPETEETSQNPDISEEVDIPYPNPAESSEEDSNEDANDVEIRSFWNALTITGVSVLSFLLLVIVGIIAYELGQRRARKQIPPPALFLEEENFPVSQLVPRVTKLYNGPPYDLQYSRRDESNKRAIGKPTMPPMPPPYPEKNYSVYHNSRY